MDVVYGKMFFTYPLVPFSKIEGAFALFLTIGGFMSWVEGMIAFVEILNPIV